MPMTVKDVASRLKVHPETVRNWIRRGQLKAIQLPTGRWGMAEYRITEEQLQEFLESKKK